MPYGTINAEQLTTQSGYTLGAGNASSFKNRIINGAMRIDQRNSGAAVTMTNPGTFDTDRWYCTNASDGVMTAQQVSDAPTGFINSLKCTTTTADASLGVSQRALIAQSIEGFNIADLAWGTASAATVTISFWTKSSLTGTFGGSLRNSAADRSYPFTYTINSANTWEQKSVTIAGDTSGTWLTTNGIGISIHFGLGVATNLSGTAGAWVAANNLSATGAVSVIGTLNATWQITGVQLEVGTVATSFDYRSYGTELALCQRYYVRYSGADGNGNFAAFFSGMNSSATAFLITPNFPVQLRAVNPTQTWGGNIRLIHPTGATATISGLTASNQQIGVMGGYGSYNVTNTGYATASPIYPSGSGDANSFWAFSSEL